ncbi:MAG TPA: hypothetical protein VJ183_05040 [Chloroflexia bacterium]|nr:hypothetical protein [Chloroflexia bacterium]
MERVGKSRILGAVLASMMLILTLAACGGDSGGGASSGKSNADLLKEAATNMKAAKSYHLEVTANMAGQDVKMSGDIDLANNKSKLDMSAAGQSVKMIAIGSDTYMSMDGGTTYTKAPGGGGLGIESFTKIWDSFKPEEVDKAKDALKDGNPKDETIGSDATRHMTANIKDLSSLSGATGGGSTEGTADIWVTTSAKPTVRKMKMAGTSDGKEMTAEIQWSNVDQSVTIEAPPTTP